MEFKLAYKSYQYGWSLSKFKRFFDATGLDLSTVLQDYIQAYATDVEQSKVAKHVQLSKLYSRDIASNIFYCITDQSLNVPLAEFDDATFMTSWFQTESVDGFSEEYPMVLLSVALAFNDYIQANIHVKKKDIGA
tara:strand:- start:616 stop:1020 length:405 start_codon:yes stop_codon:yes gene_type:complete